MCVLCARGRLGEVPLRFCIHRREFENTVRTFGGHPRSAVFVEDGAGREGGSGVGITVTSWGMGWIFWCQGETTIAVGSRMLNRSLIRHWDWRTATCATFVYGGGHRKHHTSPLLSFVGHIDRLDHRVDVVRVV